MAMAGVSHGRSSLDLGKPAESWGVKQREAPCGSGTQVSSCVLEGCGSDRCSISNKEPSEEALGIMFMLSGRAFLTGCICSFCCFSLCRL